MQRSVCLFAANMLTRLQEGRNETVDMLILRTLNDPFFRDDDNKLAGGILAVAAIA